MGYAMGAYNVGCYYRGVSECKELKYYKKSAEMGCAHGMYRVGEFYQKGLNVEKNIDIAFEWKYQEMNNDRIHSKEYLHRVLHPGNILLKEHYKAYITDLGLSKPFNEKEKEKHIHGVLPYIAPELFQKQPYTQASDIYSFGIIMIENNWICNGLRPKFGPGIPDCYIELAYQCMNSDQKKRPTSNKIILKLNEWLNIIESEVKNNSMWKNIFGCNVKNKIKSQFFRK
ncbi:kinase-like domain-containing protein [Gigaspora rosea]|uniref:Kinase-like domain-containing protein n=1 Tax=Gigaspora rosea TaxID=44941 RepID=A0A397VRC1_9GLOM|nr:kinase-like domain-containing protein [Gigaspora rosea]